MQVIFIVRCGSNVRDYIRRKRQEPRWCARHDGASQAVQYLPHVTERGTTTIIFINHTHELMYSGRTERNQEGQIGLSPAKLYVANPHKRGESRQKWMYLFTASSYSTLWRRYCALLIATSVSTDLLVRVWKRSHPPFERVTVGTTLALLLSKV